MAKVGKYFQRWEFACQCGCGHNTVDAALVTKLDALREHFGAPVKVTSGTRCEFHNRSIGGSQRSQHLIGRAADIIVRGVAPKIVQEYLEDWEGGLGSYETFTHIDSRDRKARWDG